MLYFVRHTRVGIPSGVCYGQKDVPLADSFDAELQCIKNALGDIEFSHIYSSPLQRCKTLALRLCKKNIYPIFDNRLMEMNFGLWEGVSWDDIYNDEYGQKWFSMYDSISCPNGESFGDMVARVSQFLASLPKDDGNILIVTHAGVIRSVNVITEGVSIKDSFNISVDYGQIFKVER